MKDLLKSALVAAVVSVLTAVVVMSLVGNQSDSNSKELAELVQEELGRSTSFAQVKSGDLIRFSKNLPVGNGTQLATQRNTVGHVIYVDPMNTQVLLSTRASSTGRLFIATSSDGVTIGGLKALDGGGYFASSSEPGTSLPFAPILDGLLIATNTNMNIGTGSVAALKFIQNAILDVTSDSRIGLIAVQPLEYVHVLLIEGEAGFDTNVPCQGSTDSDGENFSNCDPATSTAWGKIDVFVEFVATTTLKDF